MLHCSKTLSTWLLVQVTAPYFCAGIVLCDDVVVEAAPILCWTRGRGRDNLRAHFKRKGWRVRVVRCWQGSRDGVAEVASGEADPTRPE